MTRPLLTNARAEREWAWIVARVGQEAAEAALQAIAGNQRPYPLNVARKLGLKLPGYLAEPPPGSREVAAAALSHLHTLIKHPR